MAGVCAVIPVAAVAGVIPCEVVPGELTERDPGVVPAVAGVVAGPVDAVPVGALPEDEDWLVSAVFPDEDSLAGPFPPEVEPVLLVVPELLDAAVSDCFWSLDSVVCLVSAGCAFP